jgi:hypothetical protein
MSPKMAAAATLIFLSCAAGFMWILSREPEPAATTIPKITAPINKKTEPEPAKPVAASEEKPRDISKPQPKEIPAPQPKRDLNSAVARVEGLVVMENDIPVQSAEVFAASDSKTPLARTGYDGRFVIEDIPLTETSLIITNTTYMRATTEIVPKAGETIHVQVRLSKGGAVEGVVHRNGSPSPGEKVRFENAEIVVETDAKGHYAFNGVEPGISKIVVLFEGSDKIYVPPTWAIGDVAVESGKTSVLDFNMPTTLSSLEGSILIDGAPPERANLYAKIACDYGSFSMPVETSESGQYRIAGLPAGVVTLSANANIAGGTPRHETVDVEIGEAQAAQYDFLFTKGCAISGAVAGLTPEDQALATIVRGDVDASSVEDINSLMNMTHDRAGDSSVDDDGNYHIEGIEPGAYTLIVAAIHIPTQPNASGPPSVRVASQKVVLNTGSDIVVNLRLR